MVDLYPAQVRLVRFTNHPSPLRTVVSLNLPTPDKRDGKTLINQPHIGRLCWNLMRWCIVGTR